MIFGKVEMIMNLEEALIHGLIWSIMWCFTVNFIEINWPQVFLHDYPKELQKIITLPPLLKKKAAYTFTTIAMLIIVSFLFWAGISTYRVNEVSFWIVFWHIWIICLCWNLFDLIVMDWFIFCTWQPKFIVLPGSEGSKAYKDYKFHFVGFLKGCVILTVSSMFVAAICYGLLKLMVW